MGPGRQVAIEMCILRAGKETSQMGCVLLVVLAACVTSSSAVAQDSSKSTAARRKYIDHLTAEFRFTTEDESKRILSRSENSVLQWSWPRNGFTDGHTYVWVSNGRPQVIGGAFLIPAEKQAYYEFVSVADAALTCQRNGETVWTPPAVELPWWEIPDAPRLAETPRAKAGQMRAIARQFRGVARMGPPRYEPGARWELGLLTSPIYRYSGAGRDVLEGAIFVWAMGTDPQLLLLLEAQQREGATHWRAAFTRLSGFELAASFGEKEIWTSPKIENGHAKDSTWHLSQPLDATLLFADEGADKRSQGSSLESFQPNLYSFSR